MVWRSADCAGPGVLNPGPVFMVSWASVPMLVQMHEFPRGEAGEPA